MHNLTVIQAASQINTHSHGRLCDLLIDERPDGFAIYASYHNENDCADDCEIGFVSNNEPGAEDGSDLAASLRNVLADLYKIVPVTILIAED